VLESVLAAFDDRIGLIETARPDTIEIACRCPCRRDQELDAKMEGSVESVTIHDGGRLGGFE
jgi:hypothetical protein